MYLRLRDMFAVTDPCILLSKRVPQVFRVSQDLTSAFPLQNLSLYYMSKTYYHTRNECIGGRPISIPELFSFLSCTAKKQRPKTLESRMLEISVWELTEKGFRRSEMNGFIWNLLDSISGTEGYIYQFVLLNFSALLFIFELDFKVRDKFLTFTGSRGRADWI